MIDATVINDTYILYLGMWAICSKYMLWLPTLIFGLIGNFTS